MSQITIRYLEPIVEELIRQMAEKEEEDKGLNKVCSYLIEKAFNIDKIYRSE